MYNPYNQQYVQYFFDKRTKRYVTKEVEEVEKVEEVTLTEEEELQNDLTNTLELVGEVNSIMKINP